MGAVLMQRAAYGLANAVVRELRGRGQRLYGASVTVLAGKGNNGGDGLFAAALLARRGMRTTAVLTAGEAHPEGLAAFRKGRRPGAPPGTGATSPDAAAAAARADVVIDAVLGHRRAGRAPGSGRRADRGAGALPSRDSWWPATSPAAWTPTRGEAHGPVLRADLTVTFGAAKAGLLADPGADFTGRVQVVPIGIEAALPRPVLRRFEAGRPVGRCFPTPGGARTNTPAASWASSPARSGTPARRCWPAAARWRPASAWCATWGRRTSPTWSAGPAPKSCAAPAAPRTTARPGLAPRPGP